MPSNMIVTATQGMTPEELKQELLLLVEERQAEFGVLIRRIGNRQLKSTADPGRVSTARAKSNWKLNHGAGAIAGLTGQFGRARVSR